MMNPLQKFAQTDASRPTRRKVLLGGAALGTLALAGCSRASLSAESRVDVAIIGGGIMGATIGALLRQLQPGFRMAMFERLDAPALESSAVWHNAGTGHSALCEPNYTPVVDGQLVIDQAVRINEQFQVTRQFLASMVRLGEMQEPRRFLNAVPHMGFGIQPENVDFQRLRHDVLTQNPLFAGMEFSDDPARIAEWAPLLTEGRDPNEAVGATWHPMGTDANWGEVTRQLVASFAADDSNSLLLNTEVEDIARNPDGSWRITFRNISGDTAPRAIDANHVFNGAGGAALLLLQKSEIPESRNYGGFPVGGSFLVHEDPAIAERHLSKAYGRAATGSPPMSVPHLDTRYVDGVRRLAFGPFATFSTNFLMQDSFTALFRSVNTANLRPMLDVGIDDFGLVTYLAGQVMQTQGGRIEQVRDYFPDAPEEGWSLTQAGQRVQIIKRTDSGGGNLQFGTELVASEDGSFISLLGASPGASTAPSIMLNALQRMFPDRFGSPAWQNTIRNLVPSFGTSLAENPQQLADSWAYSDELLELRRAEDLRREFL